MVKVSKKAARSAGKIWHEVRQQEKKIHGMMVDLQRRAERRKDYYEKIRQDPAQFVRIYGRKCKVHLDSAIAMAAENPQSMMAWQGDKENMIDRFDVRAHLDYIPETKSQQPSDEDTMEERRCYYERYRTLVQNDCTGITQEQCLQEIYIDEKYGGREKMAEKAKEKAKLSDKKAAIGFTYEEKKEEKEEEGKEEEADESEESEMSDLDVEDVDLDVVLDPTTLSDEQRDALNFCATRYGMMKNDFMRMLEEDKEEEEELRQAKQLEEEKAQFSGRKSRRERKQFKEQWLKKRGETKRSDSPPIGFNSRRTTHSEEEDRSSSSRSPSPSGKVQYICSFGGGGSSDDEAPVQGPALPPALSAASDSQPEKSKLSALDRIRAESASPSPGKDGFSERRHSGSRRSVSPRSSRRRRSSSRHSPYSRRFGGRSGRTSRTANSYRRRSRSRSRRRSTSRSRRSDSRSRRRSNSRSRRRSISRSHRRSRSRTRRRSHSRSPRRSRSRRRSRSLDRSRRRSSRDSSPRSRYHSSRVRRSRSRSGRRSRSRSRRRSMPKSQRRSRSESRRSRSRSLRTRSRSGSTRTNSSRSGSRSKESDGRVSDTHSPGRETQAAAPPPVKRYRRDSLDSSSSLSLSSDEKSKESTTQESKSVTMTSKSSSKLTGAELLKKRRLAQLNRQFKMDKKVEKEKVAKQVQERIDRDEELYSLSVELRRRGRERREKDRSIRSLLDSDSDDNRDHRKRPRSGRRDQSRSRSPRTSNSFRRGDGRGRRTDY